MITLHQKESAVQLQIRAEEFHDAPENLLNLAPRPGNLLCWVGDKKQIVGWGEALRLEFSGRHAIREASSAWKEIADSAVGGVPIALASFAFGSHSTSYLVVPRVAIVRDNQGTRILTCAVDEEPTSPQREVSVSREPVNAPAGLWTAPGRMTQSQWEDAVRRLIALLKSGAAAKVVLTRDMVISSATPIDERFLAQRLHDLYPTTWVYSVAGLVGATPEMLAAKRGDTVTSRVLAGTSEPGNGAELLGSLKDRSEHHFAVESVARALSPLSDSLEVPQEPTILDLPNVTHLATDVTASIPNASVLDVIHALHPTAAVCGTPTTLAYNILETIEGTQRDRYSGPVGWVDGTGDGEFGIALRCGQLTDDRKSIRVFAGGGIMPDSVPAVELAETRAKMRPVLEALQLED